MDRETLQNLADKFSDEAAGNIIKPEQQGSEGYVGYRLFQRPIFAIAKADDPLFRELLKPRVIGAHFKLPDYWLPGAKTVISFFSPATDEVKKSNIPDLNVISTPWLYGRIEGQEYLDSLSAYLSAELNKEGIRAAVPLTDSRFERIVPTVEVPPNVNPFSTNWAERHVAYISGLGTFGLAYNLITRKGTAGRLFSIVTDWDTEADIREYTGIYDYCTKCGACIKRCPGTAITETYKNVKRCSDYIRENGKPYLPRFGCGKCQVGIPCQDGIPEKKQNMDAVVQAI